MGGETPALMCQLRETWYLTEDAGDDLAAAGYEPGETITICGDCAVRILALGVLDP
jgi:hypothetical protein